MYGLVVEAVVNGDLRLVGSSNYREGRVEMYSASNNAWGTVCDDNWDHQDARVVCRQLGFGDSGTAIHRFTPHAFPNVSIWLDNVNCNGQEARLIDCMHSGVGNSNCDHDEDAGVTCGGELPSTYVILQCFLIPYSIEV